MIYLFCNEVFGEPFLKTLLSYHRKTSIPCCIVFSTRGQASRNLRQRLQYRLKRLFMKLKYNARFTVQIRFIGDVNHSSFVESISPLDSGIVSGFNQIFSRELIDRFSSLVNFHPSVLPLYRGPCPSWWCLENREQETGFTLHRITEETDLGEILYQKSVPIENVASAEALDRKIAIAAQSCFVEWLNFRSMKVPPSRRLLVASDIYRVHVQYESFPRKEGI